MSSPEGKKVEMSSEEAYELVRLRATEEMKDDIAAWWKRRFAPTAAVIGVLVFLTGFFGGYQLIQYTAERAAEKVADQKFSEFEKRAEQLRQTENDALRAVAAAEHAARKATEGASMAESEAVKHASRVEEFNQDLAGLRERAEQLKSRADRIGELVLDLQAGATGEAQSLAAQLKGDIEDLSGRLDRMEELLEEVAGASGMEPAARAKVSEYKRVQRDYSEAGRERTAKFERNRRYEVRLYHAENNRQKAQEAEKRLAEEGFRASAISLRTVSAVFQGKIPPREMERQMPAENLIVFAQEERTVAVEIQELFASFGTFRLMARQETRGETMLEARGRPSEARVRSDERGMAGRLPALRDRIEPENERKRHLIEVYLAK